MATLRELLGSASKEGMTLEERKNIRKNCQKSKKTCLACLKFLKRYAILINGIRDYADFCCPNTKN